MNLWAQFHYIDEKGERKYRLVPVNRVDEEKIPENVDFIIVVDDNQDIKYILGILNRVRIETQEKKGEKESAYIFDKDGKRACLTYKNAQIFMGPLIFACNSLKVINSMTQ